MGGRNLASTRSAWCYVAAERRFELVKWQSVTITRDETTNSVSYNVTRGLLVLIFRLLFLRDPGPQEGDFIFSIEDLLRYAEDVWDEVPGIRNRLYRVLEPAENGGSRLTKRDSLFGLLETVF
jgi:hypothetical protein